MPKRFGRKDHRSLLKKDKLYCEFYEEQLNQYDSVKEKERKKREREDKSIVLSILHYEIVNYFTRGVMHEQSTNNNLSANNPVRF